MESLIKKSLLPLFACCTVYVSAQQQIVTGIVSDNNQPLPGATVKVNGSNKIILTDVDGKFTINDLKPGHYNLQMSYIGYDSQSMSIDLTSNKSLELESFPCFKSRKILMKL